MEGKQRELEIVRDMGDRNREKEEGMRESERAERIQRFSGNTERQKRFSSRRKNER